MRFYIILLKLTIQYLIKWDIGTRSKGQIAWYFCDLVFMISMLASNHLKVWQARQTKH